MQQLIKKIIYFNDNNGNFIELAIVFSAIFGLIALVTYLSTQL